eukprot:2288378-Prymnesium_polylepis.2
MDALSTVLASTKCSGRRSVVDVRPRRCLMVLSDSVAHAGACAVRARGYTLGDAISQEGLELCE